MKIIHSDKKEFKLKIENLDDLWYLSTIIEKGDVVESKTFRKIKIGDNEGAQKIVKKPVYLKIAVEKTEFSKYSNVFRVSGKIIEEKEDIPKGSYHTINVEQDSIIKIEKQEWLSFQLKKIKEAVSDKTAKILICVHDREEAFFALMKKYGYELLANIKGSVQKKAESASIVKNFYEEIIQMLEEYDKKYSLDSIIIASPGFWKEDLMKQLKKEGLKKKIVLATVGGCGETAINEVLKRDEVKTILQQDRISKEMVLVEHLLSEIAKEGKAVYGIEETEQAVNSGAVLDLLVTDKLIQDSIREERFERLNHIMKTADKQKATVHIISSEHDGGKKLDGLGSIAAILRYKLTY